MHLYTVLLLTNTQLGVCAKLTVSEFDEGLRVCFANFGDEALLQVKLMQFESNMTDLINEIV